MADNKLSTQISELIYTRVSHDVIGNVGAVANAVELLEEGDLEFLDDIRSILKTSSSVLTARLKFFRLAFGLHNGSLEDIPTITAAAQAYLQTLGSAGTPITLKLKLQSPEYCRIALLSIMILADTIVKGGLIEAEEEAGAFAAVVHGTHPLSAEKIANIKSVLSGIQPENQAQYAPVVYLQNILNNHKKINIIEKDMFGLVIS